MARAHVALSLAMTAILLAFIGCGGSGDQSSSPAQGDEYPLVTEPSTPGGPVKPTATEAKAGTTCERMIVPSPDGLQELVFPPPPGLTAEATSERDVLLTWSVGELPEDCEPVHMLLSILAFGKARASPTVVEEPVEAASGMVRVTYPDFLPVPDAAYAAVYSVDGRSSRTSSVLIRR